MLSSLILLPQNHLATATNFLPFSEHAFWGLFLLAVTKLLTNSWVVWSFSSSSCMAVIRLHVIIKQTWEESHSNIHKNIPAQLDVTSEEFLVCAIWKKRWNLRRNIGRYMSEKKYGKNVNTPWSGLSKFPEVVLVKSWLVLLLYLPRAWEV